MQFHPRLAALALAFACSHAAFAVQPGEPEVLPWSGGLSQVQGASPDLASSYFLDRGFWLRVLRDHPEGVVAAVPQRGGLVFASAADDDAIEELRFSAAALYAGGGGTR